MKNGLRNLLTLLIFVSLSQLLKAQDAGGNAPANPWFYGGNFGLSFGDYTLINVSPLVGYRFSEMLAAGGGVNFQYSSIKNHYDNGADYSKVSQGVVGLNIFGRFYPIRNLMLQIQPEANYVFGNEKFYTTPPYENKFNKIVPSLLGGAGLVFPAGRGATIISVFYDLLQDSSSPYGNQPIINFGYNIGF
ncbi:hypothetical protein OCK74_06000 [Chitinophagaceae bacterium LB-8]|uniref:Outer membrane protein beta-barrel domain-containing protein n=1 Tax=Paraflavisolibacter caeni TaxID=2982496 RepID=A0A9X3B6Z2_9BACT|nr:hypothetical protein [Paraflavisolibacter caeni]MCU7548660.1 hypothetical protein [Paraflavisolibacter caeni]